MSSRGGSSNNGGGVQSIPAASRKMVQSLKEIVNCPEHEIYSMLKECNMDPNDAVNRLLSQDPFHEVKSKREKKKESKDPTESRSRGASSTSNRGVRGATDRYVGWSSSTQFNASESGGLHGKSAYKKENGTNAYMSSLSSTSGVPGSTMNRRHPVLSDSVTTENKGSTTGTFDGSSSLPSQPSSGYQPAWSGVPGQMSMADIVKMGRPHGKASTPTLSHQTLDNLHVQAPPSTALRYDLRSSESHASKESEMNPEPGLGTAQNISPNDEWILVEQPPTATGPSGLESPADSQHSQSWADEVGPTEDGSVEDLHKNHIAPASDSNRKMQEDNFGGLSLYDNDLHNNLGSYQSHRHTFHHDEVEDVAGSVSSVTTNLQQLSVQDDRGAAPEEDHPSVVIPNHLQVQTAECSHLSFGSFGSGINATSSGLFSSRPLTSNLEEEPLEADASSIGNSDTRNAEYYGDEPLRTAVEGNLVHIAGANAGNYDSQSSSQPEVLRQESPEAAHGNQYAYPSSTPGYSFETAQQLNAGYSHSQSVSQMQNISPYSSVMAYTNSLPSTLLAASGQPVRESDLPYSPFPVTQSMPTKYGNAVSSMSSSAISMPEGLKTGTFSSTQPTPQTQAGTSIATGPALPQHLAMHPYSQPTLPLGPFANMISYPFLPQSYTYMPSAFQQAFAGNSTYHQSLAAVLPQYKNSVSVSNLPQSAAIPSGYGVFGSSNSIPGNFPMNPSPAAPAGSTIGYDDILSSQYKDNLISLQQNENSAMWVHGPGSRTMSAVPASTYYSFQGQNQQQQPAGFRQAQQQPSQNYGALGYPNFYHSQTGMSLEHQQQQQQQQQQNPRDSSQGQSSKQSQQLWQGTY